MAGEGQPKDQDRTSSREDVLAFASEVKLLALDINATFAALLRPLGLTPVQADTLMALEQLGPVTLKELSHHLVAESGHPSRLVSRLQSDGLVNRQPADQDGRAISIHLTEKGHDLARRALDLREPLLETFAADYGSRIRGIVPLLRELRISLAQSAKTPPQDS